MATKKGALHTKLEPRRLPLLADDTRKLEIMRGWDDEDHAKLLLLCEELGIDDGPARFYFLALALARKQYPGFQVRKPTTKWTDWTGGYLVVEVKRLISDRRQNPGHTVSWATDQLAKRSEWKEFLGGGQDRGEALRVQYARLKAKPWSRLMWRLFKMEQQVGALENRQAELLENWQADLLDALKHPHPESREND